MGRPQTVADVRKMLRAESEETPALPQEPDLVGSEGGEDEPLSPFISAPMAEIKVTETSPDDQQADDQAEGGEQTAGGEQADPPKAKSGGKAG